MFKFHCPHCQQHISAEASQIGISAHCPTCGGGFVVPQAEEMEPREPGHEASHERQTPDIPTPQETALTTPTQAPGSSNSFGERVKDGSIAMKKGAQIVKESTKVGWLSLKRRSKQAALRAQIEKLRQVDLRKALHELGEKAFNKGVLADTLISQYQAIHDLDARISELREKSTAESAESKMAALKRMGKETAKAGHAKSLSLKREHLITVLGRDLQSHEVDWSTHEMSEEWNAVQMIEQQIRHNEEEIREMGTEEASTSSFPAGAHLTPFSYRSAVPLFVCCLGFGWLVTWFLPMRIFTPELGFSSALGVGLLAIPALIISYLSIGQFLGFPKSNIKHLVGAMAFTMFAGILILFTFYKIADASQSMKTGFYGRATPIVLAVKLIGWSSEFHTQGNLVQRLFASVVHTGFCEEVTKMLPLFLLVILNRKKDGLPDLRGFLMIAFFSGLGFGIAEAVKVYSPWSGNPVLESNVIRWYACVPLHAIYTIIDASLLWLLIPEFKKAKSVGVATAILLIAATVVAVIHGLYNTISGLHNLIGLILDGGAIAFMVFIVRFCLNREQGVIHTDTGMSFSGGILPAWLKSKDRSHPSFRRMFVAAGILLLISTVFAFSPPPLSSSAAQSFAAEVEAKLGIVLDDEAALMYAGGYAIGSSANRPAPAGAFEYIVNQTMAQNPGLPAAFGELLYLGMQDGYNNMPNRLESGSSSFGRSPASSDHGGSGYRFNQADKIAIGRFNDTYGVTHTIGKRNGMNDLEILIAAVDATDWSGASQSLRSALHDFKSIRSGESAESRNRKLEPLMKIVEFY